MSAVVDNTQLVDRWRALRAKLDSANVKLLAVSKYASDEAVRLLIEAGQRDFGESRAQNLRHRAEKFPDVDWHMIGPLQKNKAKYIGRHAAMWHSAEDLNTATAVAEHVHGRRLPVMLQVNVAGLIHQHGVSPEDLPGLFAQLGAIPRLEVRGLMCMAPKGGDARGCFRSLRLLRDQLMNGSLRPPCAADSRAPRLELSMGMSGDYRIAIEEGANIVRLGSVLFGPKRYV